MTEIITVQDCLADYLKKLNLALQVSSLQVSSLERIKELIERTDTVSNFQAIYLFRHLNRNDRLQYFAKVKQTLVEITKTGIDFQAICSCLDENDLLQYLALIKKKLPEITKTGIDFQAIYLLLEMIDSHLNQNNRSEYFALVQEKLPEITKTGIDFQAICFSLKPDPENQSQYYSAVLAVKDKLLEITHTVSDFQAIGSCLDEKDRPEYFSALSKVKGKLPEITNTGFDFQAICSRLNEEDQPQYFSAVKEKLLKIIQSAEDFYRVLQFLSEEQRVIVFNQLNENSSWDWYQRIQSAEDFYRVLQFLPEEQRVIVFNQLNSQDNYWVELIQNIQDLKDILSVECLTDLQCQIIYESLREQKPSLFTDENMLDLLNSLPKAKCSFVCQTLLYDRSRLRKFVHFLENNNSAFPPKGHIKCALFHTYTIVREKEQKKFLGRRGLFPYFFKSYSRESKIKAARGAIKNQLDDSDKKALNEGLLGKIHQLRA